MSEIEDKELSRQELEAMGEPESKIKPISKDTIHKICSGQVVLTLAVAVKELVENAVDAGATLVEVKLYEQGLESIEVSDNGCGVAEANLEAMTAKYCTSKLQQFVDLLNVETFGFRGEALSSLCALSNMSVVTRHKSSDVAIKIELDHDGKIVKRSRCSRSIGTTVTLKKLFETLPVRRRDFIRNVKREFTKMCNMMQAYCLVAKGIRLILSNYNAKGAKTVVMQTHGAQDVLANITAVFGVKQSNELLALRPAFDNINTLTKETLLEELSMVDNKAETLKINDDDLDCLKYDQFRLECYISSCSHGFGRSSKDRQFYYVNSRPCDSKNLSKIVNDMYHRYNANQYPFVYLNVILNRSDVDVNVTPDKRSLFLKNEKLLLMLLKKSLANTFGHVPAQHKLENISIASIFKVEHKTENKPTNTSPDVDIGNESSTIKNDGEGKQEGKSTPPDVDRLIPISTAKNFMNVLSQWKRTGDTIGPPASSCVNSNKRKCLSEIEVRTLKMQKIQNYLSQELPKSSENNQFASYKSESDSDNEDDDRSFVKESSLEQSFPNIQKINKASQEYDIIVSAPTVNRIDCKVSGPAKPFLTFIKEKPILRNVCANNDVSKTQKSFASKENLDFCFSSTSKNSKENIEGKSPVAETTIVNSESDDDSLDFELKNEKREYKLSFLKYDSQGESLPNTQESRNDFCFPSTSKASIRNIEIKLPSSQTAVINSDSDMEASDFENKHEPELEVNEETKGNCDNGNGENNLKPSIPKTIILDEANDESKMENISCIVMKTSIEEIAALMEAESKYREEMKCKKDAKRLRFKSEINPTENKKAEEELQTEISKSDFVRMEIIGQFNLGFIIVKLEDDLFIVDQHATDEKYNFEKLQETTVVRSQRLVIPQQLQLTVVNEMVLMDHLDVFEKNGFQFQIDANAPPMQKVRLIAKPVSKNWEFGKEDIDELIFMLQDAPSGTICRPSRMRAMFASRACRKSVMIGKRLNEVDMKTLVTHMGEIEQPWNCPHGRPTIRHLINMGMLEKDSDDSSDDSTDESNPYSSDDSSKTISKGSGSDSEDT